MDKAYNDCMNLFGECIRLALKLLPYALLVVAAYLALNILIFICLAAAVVGYVRFLHYFVPFFKKIYFFVCRRQQPDTPIKKILPLIKSGNMGNMFLESWYCVEEFCQHQQNKFFNRSTNRQIHPGDASPPQLMYGYIKYLWGAGWWKRLIGIFSICPYIVYYSGSVLGYVFLMLICSIATFLFFVLNSIKK